MHKLNHGHIFKVYKCLSLRHDEIFHELMKMFYGRRNIGHHYPLVVTCSNVFERV